MLDPTTPVVIAARRTPITTVGGRLSTVSAHELAGTVVRVVFDDAVDLLESPPVVADVVLGNCMGPGGNTARLATLAAGLPVDVPGATVDRQCGSGLAAVLMAADGLAAEGLATTGPADNASTRADRSATGEHVRVRIAGGVESASTAPTRSIAGVSYSRAPFTPNGFPDPDMAAAAESLAAERGIGRDRQDAYAARSHTLALAAVSAGRFDAELVGVELVGVEAGTVSGIASGIVSGTAQRAGHTLLIDDGPRPRMATVLPRFPTIVPSDGHTSATLTAGNSCRVSDGAAAVALVQNRHRGSAPGLALVAQATVGCDPAHPGFGAEPAVRAVLARAGVGLDSVAAIEIVEAFAGQTLAVLDALGLAVPLGEHPTSVDDRVCADGGALALGHPWGASGAIGVVRLFSRLVRSGAPAGSLGIATAAVGGGMGVAALFEVVR